MIGSDSIQKISVIVPKSPFVKPQLNEIKHCQSRSRKSAQDDKWSFCLTAGTLCPANQERQ